MVFALIGRLIILSAICFGIYVAYKIIQPGKNRYKEWARDTLEGLKEAIKLE